MSEFEGGGDHVSTGSEGAVPTSEGETGIDAALGNMANESVPTEGTGAEGTNASPTNTTPGTDAEANTNTEAAPAPKPNPTPDKAVEETIEVKVDGKIKKVPLSELKSKYSLADQAYSKFEEAANTRKQAESILNALKQDPLSILTHPNLGIDFKQIAESYLIDQMQQDQLSPEEKAFRQRQQELETREQQVQRLEQERQTKENEARAQHYRQKFDQDISAALNDASLPKNPTTVRRVAGYLKQAIAAGVDLAPSDVVSHVRESYMNEMTSLVSDMSGPQLMDFLGKDVVEKVRKSLLTPINPEAAEKVLPDTNNLQAPTPSKPKSGPSVPAIDFFDNL